MARLVLKLFCLLLFVAIGGLTLATTSLGHANGAHAGWGDQGCTCHAQAPTAGIGVIVDGVAEHWEPGQTYEVTVRIQGGNAPLPAPVGQNAGGFALDFDAGKMTPNDDSTQVVGNTVTHTARGNDVRQWKFQWTAPTNATMVNFKAAVNAVNGDARADIVDQWNKKAFAFGSHPMENMTEPMPTETAPTDSPSPAAWLTLAGIGIGVAWLRRRPS